MSGVGVSGMHGAGWGGRDWFMWHAYADHVYMILMADAEVAENVGFW